MNMEKNIDEDSELKRIINSESEIVSFIDIINFCYLNDIFCILLYRKIILWNSIIELNEGDLINQNNEIKSEIFKKLEDNLFIVSDLKIKCDKNTKIKKYKIRLDYLLSIDKMYDLHIKKIIRKKIQLIRNSIWVYKKRIKNNKK